MSRRNIDIETKENKKSGKQGKILKVFGIILLIIALILMGFGIGTYIYLKGKVDKIEKEHIDTSKIGIEEKTEKQLEGYRNIAILGIDSRSDSYEKGNRSDAVFIASINQKNGEVNLISVYRDTYIDVEENGYTRLDKLTHAYSYGGAQNALKSLNNALDLNIKEFVAVNFNAVVDAVDALKGVDIDITAEEMRYMNRYIPEIERVTGKKGGVITSAGTNHLNGVQALAYSRIRYTSGGDYKRTERMRTVIEAMLKKSKKLSPIELNNATDIILPKIRTNISTNEILKTIPQLVKYNIKNNFGWPYNVRGITLDRWYGVPVTLQSNVEKLHKDLFKEENYEASEKVKDMSKRIIKKTNYRE
ncbi:MAG: LCP family protein [Clostridium sp.]